MDNNQRESAIELESKQKNKINQVKPDNQQDTDQDYHDDQMDEDDELEDNENNNENTKDNSVNQSKTENQDDFDFTEEPESRDKIIRKELDKYLTQHPAGKVIKIFIAITSVISSVTYIVMTHQDWSPYGDCCMAQTNPDADPKYKKDCYPKCDEYYFSRMPQTYETIDLLIGFIYLIYYLLVLFTQQNRGTYFFSSESIQDLIIIVPLFLPFDTSAVGLVLKAVSRLIRLYKVRWLLKSEQIGEEEKVKEHIKLITTDLLISVIICAGLYMVLENFQYKNLEENFGIERYNFQLSIYYMCVTLLTVGYGDYYPVTPQGRLFMVGTITFIIVYKLPMHIAELSRLFSLKSPHARKAYQPNNEVPHVVVTGQVVLQALKNFCEELFHPDHGTQEKHAVILQFCDPSNEMEMFFSEPDYEKKVTYINGNPMVSTSHKRTDLKHAETCILLTNKNSKDAISVDHNNILIGLAMKKYVYATCQKNLRICMQLIKPESKQHFYSSATNTSASDQIIIVEEIKMNLMSKSCFSPGIINLISNLISSSPDADDDFESQWLRQYAGGMGHEIYRVKLSEKVEGRTFADICGLVYKQQLNSIVFAIEIKTNGQTIIRLNPSNFVVNNIVDNEIYVYVICPGAYEAEQIETLNMNKEETNSYLAKRLKQRDNNKNKDEDGQGEDNQEDPQIDEQQAASMDSMRAIADGDQIYQQEWEDKKMMNDYYMYSSEDARSIISQTLASLENTEIKNHIVVCGIHSAIKSFIMPLRARYLHKFQLQKIVIITGEPNEKSGDHIDPHIWSSISRFHDVFIVNGSPLNQETLYNANIHFADKVVILGHDSTLQSDVSDEMLDAESIYIYQAVRKVNKNVQILTELVYSENIEFLLQQYPPNNDYKLSNLYAAGEVYISAIIDTLTCQSYYNKNIVNILQQILKGASEEEDEQLRETMKAHPDLTQSNLWQIPVPQECVNKTFEDLFHFLLSKKLICLALYRLKGATDNSLYPYVYTNPASNVQITHRDKVFVLGINIPQDLQGDIYEMYEQNEEVRIGKPEELLEMQMQRKAEAKKAQKLKQQGKKMQKKRADGKTGESDEEISEQNQDASTLTGLEEEEEQQKYKTASSKAKMDDSEKQVLGLKLSSVQNAPPIQSIAKKLEKKINIIEKAVDQIKKVTEDQNDFILETTKQITQDYLRPCASEFQERIQKNKMD